MHILSRLAANELQTASNAQKNCALSAIHSYLAAHKDRIIKANKLDLQVATSEKISKHLYNRLNLESKYTDLLQGVLDVAKLDDPTRKCTLSRKLDENLDLYRVTCPVGVMLVIFEARPEVVVQITCLAIKSVILKGGKEAYNTNLALFETIREAITSIGISNIPVNCVNFVSTRDEIQPLLKMNEYIDLVIPRGSKELVRHIQESTTIPVLGHADGLCSIYVDKDADLEMACKIIVDSKTNYPSACNSVEKILFHIDGAARLIPAIANALFKSNVMIYADSTCMQYIPKNDSLLRLATEDSFTTEFLNLTISMKAVENMSEAINHINRFGSHHTDCIITASSLNAEEFMRRVDSAGTFWNASTRFADGFRYGFGAEIGVSTNKTHARGPVGLEGLVIYRYRLYGNGQCVGEYGSAGTKTYLHEDLPTRLFL